MDALDAMILREFGMDPFIAWPRRNAGLKLSDVARKLDRNLQFVKDRVERMEQDGVIVGYRLFPNLRHCGLEFSTFLWPAGFVPEKGVLSRLSSVDGFVGVVWSLDSNLCVDLTASTRAERERRLGLIGQLLGLDGAPQVLFARQFPAVQRALSPLDWRIIHAMERDARRSLSDVADELGVTAKTVRTRYHAMWSEGSIDTHVVLDFERMTGIIPFAISIWYEDGAAGVEARVLDHFADRYLDHLVCPPAGHCPLQVRVFAYTPAEVQALVREAISIAGVKRAEPFLVTGAYYTDHWLGELLERQIGSEAAHAPQTGVPG